MYIGICTLYKSHIFYFRSGQAVYYVLIALVQNFNLIIHEIMANIKLTGELINGFFKYYITKD